MNVEINGEPVNKDGTPLSQDEKDMLRITAEINYLATALENGYFPNGKPIQSPRHRRHIRNIMFDKRVALKRLIKSAKKDG